MQESKLMPMIIVILDQHGGIIYGAENLALELNAPKYHVNALARRLARMGEIIIKRSNGGRGNKTVYKRNRNNPGIPRRKR